MTRSRSQRAAWVAVVICGISFHIAHLSYAQTSAWDSGIPKDRFKDDQTPKDPKNPKKAQKLTHRLAPTDCDDCQKIVDQLQNALDDWYALELADANDTIKKSVAGENTAVSQKDAREQKDDAMAGLGQKDRPPPKGKSKADVNKEIKRLSEELANCLKKCEATPTPTPTTPAPATGGPGGDGKTTGGGEQPPANAPKPEHVIKIDFIINRGATLDENGAGGKTQEQEDKEIDGYLDKLNKTFSGSGIGFKRNSTTHVNDAKRPEYPETGGEENKASDEQKKIAKEAEAEAKKLKNKGDITVKIVHNFHDKDKPDGSPASIQGITIGPTIIVVDPWDVKRNTLGSETWDHTMAHELGHRLGLDHTILPSDKQYEHQKNGVYEEPNVMSPGHGPTKEADEFTPDQISEMKKQYDKEFGTGNKPEEKTLKNELPGHGMAPARPTGGEYVCFNGPNMSVAIIGTGETIGHVADAKIDNLTDQSITCAIPATVLESRSGKSQDYVVPRGQDVALGPHESKTVPLDGVCVNRHKPPVGNAVGGDLAMNDPSGNVPHDEHSRLKPDDTDKLLRIATSKYDAADKLEQDGLLNDIPYKDKKKRKEIVEQWSVWSDPRISEIEGGPPATKDDLKKVVEKQVGKVPPAEKKKIDKGIDTIWDKIELTTTKAKDLEQPSEEETPATGENSGNTFNISNDTPPPGGQTREKPKKEKKKKKWPKPVQDWLDAKDAADKADNAKRHAQHDYFRAMYPYFRKSKHHEELAQAANEARKKAEAPNATQQDKDNYKNARGELEKNEAELEKDFQQTDDGKKAFGKLNDADKAANTAHDAEKAAEKNLPPGVDKDAVAAQHAAETGPSHMW